MDGKRSQRCEPPPAGHPNGTLSQIVYYTDRAGNRVAVVHQHLLSDGTIGGSGRPDPKYLRHDGVIYTPAEDPS